MIAHAIFPAKCGYQDAIAMLKTDHEEVRLLFAEFDKLKNEDRPKDKARIVGQLCTALQVHAALEEQIFYPAVREAIGDNELMDEAMAHHAGVKELVADLQETNPGDDLYGAKVRVLREQVQHHVIEVESRIFPKAIESKVDTSALGATMRKRKYAFMAETRSLYIPPKSESNAI